MSQPRMLYLSPVVPALAGNGLAMRSGIVLEILARHYCVWLLVRTLYPSPAPAVPALLARLCEESTVLPASGVQPAPGRRMRDVLRRPRSPEPFRDVPFDVVHVFRLAMVPAAHPYLSGSRPPQRHLDLDDLESRTNRRLAELYRRNGDETGARLAELRANVAELAEEEVLKRWDRIYVCSHGDRAAVTRGGTRVSVLPNAVRLPASPLPPSPSGPFTFLFVGTLAYFPNEDGMLFFCRRVMPLIRARSGASFRVLVVGMGTGSMLDALGGIPEVRLVGGVPDTGPWYGEAHAVVVPVRAGGGTRIKVLEAFAYGRPVVSTSLGCEGIEVLDGVHVLLGDTPERFAHHCVALMEDAPLRARLSANARALVRDRYTMEAISSAVEPVARYTTLSEAEAGMPFRRGAE